MTRPRSQIVSLEDTLYYHCVSRCVRRSWLCGEDSYTGNNYEHRKPWLLDRLKLLGEVFAIDIPGYAVMSNHYHVLLHVDQVRGQSWGRDEVIRRWLCLYKGDPLVHQYLEGKLRSKSEFRQLDRIVDTWRERLTNVSWFMKCLNEYIARKANQEDDCTGRFWEGRFKSQALLDEAALLSCMVYVDLNPVRAGMSETLEDSDFTSIQARIRQVAKGSKAKVKRTVPRLMPFQGEQTDQAERSAVLPYSLKDYVELVVWTGRIVREDKKESIPEGRPTILASLRLTSAQWQTLALEIQREAVTMFNGLNRLAARERARARKVA